MPFINDKQSKTVEDFCRIAEENNSLWDLNSTLSGLKPIGDLLIEPFLLLLL